MRVHTLRNTVCFTSCKKVIVEESRLDMTLLSYQRFTYTTSLQTFLGIITEHNELLRLFYTIGRILVKIKTSQQKMLSSLNLVFYETKLLYHTYYGFQILNHKQFTTTYLDTGSILRPELFQMETIIHKVLLFCELI